MSGHSVYVCTIHVSAMDSVAWRNVVILKILLSGWLMDHFM